MNNNQNTIAQYETNAPRSTSEPIYQGTASSGSAEIDEINRLARLCEAKDAEIEQAKYQRNGAMEQYLESQKAWRVSQQQLSEAQAQIAMKDEALKLADERLDEELLPMEGYTRSTIWNAISATAETVAAWRAKETEPLLSKIAELETNERAYEQIIGPCTYQEVADERNKLRREVATLRDTLVILDKYIPVGSTIKVLEDTQATALAYEQEVEQRGAVKALEELKRRVDSSGLTIAGILDTMLAELRASKGAVK